MSPTKLKEKKVRSLPITSEEHAVGEEDLAQEALKLNTDFFENLSAGNFEELY